jgi:hypothetical protein
LSRRSAFDALSLAFQHSRQQLWPFRWSQWWRLAVLGFVTGELGGGGGGVGRSVGRLPSIPSSSDTPDVSTWPPDLTWFQDHVALIITAALVIVVIVGLLLLLWTYVSSICRFVLIDAIVSKRCDGIRAGWAKWRDVGRPYFVWQLLLQLVVTIVAAAPVLVVLIVAWRAGWFEPEHPNTAAIVASLLAIVGTLIVVGVIAMVVYVLGKDFVAPIMAVDRRGWRDAWKQTIALMRVEPGSFAAYIGVKIVMTIVVGILVAVAALVVLVPLVLAGIAIVVSIGGFDVLQHPEMLVLVIAAGGVVLLLFAIVMACLCVPLVVLFPAYGLYFLAARYPSLDAWLASEPGAGRDMPALAT